MSESRTPRLYFDAPHALTFHTHVIAHGESNGAPAVILERSAFYPEGGGQLPDIGHLDSVAVTDVQSDAAGQVLHVLDGALPPIGSPVTGAVDARRRREQMALHTAQHLLSQALFVHAGAETVAARLGEQGGSIDTDKKEISVKALHAAVDAVNALIDADAVVDARIVGPDELRTLPLRAPPKVSGDVRVVFAADYDVTPCGGTHVTKTSQIGVVHITQTERVKGRTRVHFVAGAPARAYLMQADNILRTLCADLTCGREGVGEVVEKQRAQIKAQRQTLGQLWAEVATHRAREICDALTGPLVVLEHARDDAYLRALNAAFGRAERAAIIVHDADAGCDVLLTSPDVTQLDCKALLAELAAKLDGKGGGKPLSARGRFAGPAMPIATAAAAALGCEVANVPDAETP